MIILHCYIYMGQLLKNRRPSGLYDLTTMEVNQIIKDRERTILNKPQTLITPWLTRVWNGDMQEPPFVPSLTMVFERASVQPLQLVSR
jgi:hypothetical protein